MRTFLILFLILFISLPVYAEQLPIGAAYWIVGKVPDVGKIKADGRTVVFYKNYNKQNQKYEQYAVGKIFGNTFMLNAFGAPGFTAAAGEKYNILVARGDDTYGVDFKPLTISGIGYDDVGTLTLTAGGGWGEPEKPLPPEAPPKIKIWFGNRLYQPKLVEKGEKFVVSSTPKIRADITIDDPYTLAKNIADYSIVLDPGTAASKTLTLQAQHMTQKVYAAGTAPEEEKIKAFSLEYSLTEAEALSDGEHTFAFGAKSSGLIGIASAVTELASVEVMGGPARLVGSPVTFPSPFSIRRHGTVTIQYQLSRDTNIQIILVDISARRVKNFVFKAGEEGGSAGINKVTWDGMTEWGTLAGNGVYLGTIIAQDEGRKLGSVKLTIVD